MGNQAIKDGIVGVKGSWSFMYRNGMEGDWIGRVCPSKLIAIKKPIRMLDSSSVLKCRSIMSRASQSMSIVDNAKVRWQVSNLHSIKSDDRLR